MYCDRRPDTRYKDIWVFYYMFLLSQTNIFKCREPERSNSLTRIFNSRSAKSGSGTTPRLMAWTRASQSPGPWVSDLTWRIPLSCRTPRLTSTKETSSSFQPLQLEIYSHSWRSLEMNMKYIASWSCSDCWENEIHLYFSLSNNHCTEESHVLRQHDNPCKLCD